MTCHGSCCKTGVDVISSLLKEVSQLMGLQVSTTAYHPQTDGLDERFN